MSTTKSTVQAAIYCRISKDKTGLRAGVERQREDCAALAQRNGWEVIRVYVDNDISAYSGKRRPQYEQLRDDIKHGTVNAVLCWHPDRLHRRSIELEGWLDLVGDDVLHATVTAGLWDLSTPSGRMTARILGAVAQHESEHRSERVRTAKAVDARNGKHHGGIRCWGYELDGLTIRESEAVEIRRLADAITRGVSLRSLARELNERGIPTSTGRKPWSQAHLSSTLAAPRLAGLSTHNGEVVGKGKWPAILDETTYAAVLSVLNDPKRKNGPRTGRTPTSLGTGLYRCGVCAEPTMRISRNANGQRVYRCSGSTAIDGGQRGGHVSRSADTLDEFVTDAVIGRLSQPGFVQAMADRVSAGADDTGAQAALIAERDEIRTDLRELGKTMDSKAIPSNLLLQLTNQIQQKTARSDEIGHLLAQAGQRSPVSVLIGVDDIEGAWHAMALPLQRAILDAVVTVTVKLGGKRGRYFDPSAVTLDFN